MLPFQQHSDAAAAGQLSTARDMQNVHVQTGPLPPSHSDADWLAGMLLLRPRWSGMLRLHSVLQSACPGTEAKRSNRNDSIPLH